MFQHVNLCERLYEIISCHMPKILLLKWLRIQKSLCWSEHGDIQYDWKIKVLCHTVSNGS